MSTAPMVRIAIGGPLIGGQRWSTGFSVHLDPGSTASQSQMNDYAASVYGAFVEAGSPGEDGTGIFELSNCHGCFAETIRADLYAAGSATAAVQGAYEPASPAGGIQAAASANPPQLAVVASLLTGFPGRKYRGRMYWPWLYQGYVASGQVIDAQANALATQVAHWFTAVNGIELNSHLGTVAVATPRDNSIVPGMVSTVRVDTLVDTQRRRRDKLAAIGIHSASV